MLFLLAGDPPFRWQTANRKRYNLLYGEQICRMESGHARQWRSGGRRALFTLSKRAIFASASKDGGIWCLSG
jgi:hypothetical protein